MKIETKDYYWECGEPGCCSEYGTILYIDGKQVTDRSFSSECDAYRYILEELLGHEIGYIDDEEEESQ
jgi:hypothetical protein